jgi:hypothetical protein
MSSKKFRITKDAFLKYLLSEKEEESFWDKKLIKELMEHDHIVHLSTHKIFEAEESLPGHLFKAFFSKEELEECEDMQDIPISEIALVKKL